MLHHFTVEIVEKSTNQVIRCQTVEAVNRRAAAWTAMLQCDQRFYCAGYVYQEE